MTGLEERRLRRRLNFLHSLRIAVLAALILVSSIILLFFQTRFPILPIIVSLTVAMVISILYFPLARMIRFKWLLLLQLQLDIVMITFLVYFSGGIVSPFYFLYILPIIVSAIFLSRRDTIFIATVSFISFGILSDLLYLKIIPFFPGMETLDVTLGDFVYNLLMSFIAFSSMAVLSSYYFDRIRRTDAELRSAQEDLQSLTMLNNSVFEKMENGLIITDELGTIISYNNKARLLLDFRESVNAFHLLLNEEEQQRLLQLTQAGNTHYFERPYRQYHLGVSISLVEKISEYEKLFVFLITDLTSIKGIEKKLKESENLAIIGEMIASIAHEIRNPLASISGSVQFLQKELKLQPEFQNLMRIIVRESERLSKSINEILNFSRTTPLVLQEFDLAEVVDEILDLIEVRYNRLQIGRLYGRQNTVIADVDKVKQLVWNIVDNAIKAVAEAGVVDVCIYRNGRDQLFLSVKDQGLGMDSEEKEKIFTPFYSKFTSGIGLGMAIVQRIVEEHGFAIDIASYKNKGTEVTICFAKE